MDGHKPRPDTTSVRCLHQSYVAIGAVEQKPDDEPEHRYIWANRRSLSSSGCVALWKVVANQNFTVSPNTFVAIDNYDEVPTGLGFAINLKRMKFHWGADMEIHNSQ
eukprot:TRINITY_DN1533_c0_g1_i2.p2 TRINITY_DN1533_c0_g1~~TRINITY_DN1533_c0_g1_i2.p2  ORF type:complete len:107 (-),score=26.31 TRINITY_DN1533_c0_g1_i2:22-342(-)